MENHDREHFSALGCPSSVTWTNDISKMFTQTDISHMKTKGIDLGDYRSVSINAVAIYSRVKSGSMPPPGSGEDRWTADMVNLFGCWIQQNTPE
ncbi:hypothetical protein [Paracoccus zhejiangensis]|uniref:Uncharacterized protein n=1 Tax=Paracoccus zhejiangensis TaxID=1077935 RepID=A0A2H5F4S2_9RHOB|nr:hypothetical protein [Paracoccus zhejiangensis]AUH66549.1 hypothetical protein CX676_19770 [Paracoccus zhejiangensis]